MQYQTDSARAILSITGEDRIHFLQGILTQDVTKLALDHIQFAALLSPQGKILHDMFLVWQGETILIDTQAKYKDTLLKRLTMYKLRAKVTIEDVSQKMGVSYHPEGRADPRHPDLPHRLYTYEPHESGATNHEPRNLGIPELGIDFEPDTIVPLDAGYDLLNAISFTKGCYVGQEVTARMHYKQIARRGFYRLHCKGLEPRLCVLKFAEVEAANGKATVDNTTYDVSLPTWMEPKLTQFKSSGENQ